MSLKTEIHWADAHLDELSGKTVILRVSLNLPLSDDGRVLDEFRLQKALPGIRQLSKIAKSLFIIAHIGKSGSVSLEPVSKLLKKEIKGLKFVKKDDYFTPKKPGIYLFENLRAFEGEVLNDVTFAKSLAGMADAFVQDAFSVMHRAHASVVLLPKFLPSFGGRLLKEELLHMNEALAPQKPSAFVLGGAKFATKEPLIAKMLERYDRVLLTGALANEALAAKGVNVGKSKIEDARMPDGILKNPKLFLPSKYTVSGRRGLRKSNGLDIRDDELIVDAFSPLTFLQGMNFLLWNGPFGWYEEGYEQGTASFINQIDIFRPRTIAGGGDSNALIDKMDADELFAFRSTGGGAMLSYLVNETLPGLEALKR